MPRNALALSPGIVKNETGLAAAPHFTDGDKIRFYRRRAQPMGGHEYASIDSFVGLARGGFRWQANDGRRFAALGTHRKLYVLAGGMLYDVTPIRSSATLGANPVSTTSGSATVAIAHTSHGASDGAVVYISGAAAVGGITIGGSTGTMSAGAFAVESGSRLVMVTHSAHGLATGDIAVFASASAVGGITPNGTFTIRRVDDDTFQFEFTSAATSTATGGGTPTWEYFKAYTLTYVGANSYTVTHSAAASSTASGGGASVKVKYEINPGNEHGEGGGGFGVGTFGSGLFGVGSGTTADGGQTYPRTWSMAPWGQYLNACPRGGTAYEWQLITSQRAAAITNAPAQIGSIFVTPQRQLVAVGMTSGGSFQAMTVGWTDQEDNTVWTASATNLAGDYPLSIGSQLVRGLSADGQNLIWSDTQLYAMRYLGDPQYVFSFVPVGQSNGLIGPNAAAMSDERALWLAPDKQFHVFDGTSRILECPVRDHLFDNLSPAQEEKIYIGNNADFAEFVCFYPTGSGLECNRYVVASQMEGAGWAIGTYDRTCWVGRSSDGEALAAGTDGRLYYHESGTGANGAGLGATVTTHEFQPNPRGRADLCRLFCDVQDLAVGLNVTVLAREETQGTQTSFGPYLISPGTSILDFDPKPDGRIFEFVFASADDANAYWRLGNLSYEWADAGER